MRCQSHTGGMFADISVAPLVERLAGLKTIRECIYTKELDLETLICTRGAAFPISMLESRLKCPRCDSRRVVIIYSFPSNGRSQRVA